MLQRCLQVSRNTRAHASGTPQEDVSSILSRRLLFVVGKGGTGKTSVAAALALVASRQGRRVLLIDVDTKGDTARAFGATPGGFAPKVVHPQIQVLALQPEAALQEYLSVYFKVPRFTRFTPLAKVFDFVATSVPGPRDMLVIGKIAYEEHRVDRKGRPIWDLIIVDAAATGHALPQLAAARSMLALIGGGVIKSHVGWINETLSDTGRTALVVTATPEEMAITEAVELIERASDETGVNVCGAILNRVVAETMSKEDLARVGRSAGPAVDPDGWKRLCSGLPFVVELAREGALHAASFAARVAVPIIPLPLLMDARPGLSVTRALAAQLGSGS